MKKMDQSYKTSLEKYMKEKNYGNLSYINNIGEEFDNQVQSVDLVIIILIVCAGALNFIVLYNLTNINIQERKSEIATIKVLGFRQMCIRDSRNLKEGLMLMNQKMPGFIDEDTLLTGVEARSSAPVRILRNEYLESSSPVSYTHLFHHIELLLQLLLLDCSLVLIESLK